MRNDERPPQGIPRRIIQTGRSADLPLVSKASIASIRSLNPGYEHLFFDDAQVAEFIQARFPQYEQVFFTFKYPIQRYDFFRYLAVYHFGGFYFDLDVFLAKGLDDLLQFDCVFPFEELTLNRFLRERFGMDWGIGNYAFGAAPRHPFLAAIISNCVKAQSTPCWAREMHCPFPSLGYWFHILNTSGPGLVTRTFAEGWGGQPPVRILFPPDVRDPGSWHKFGDYGVHLMQGTWENKRTLSGRIALRCWDIYSRRRLMRECRSTGPTRMIEDGMTPG